MHKPNPDTIARLLNQAGEHLKEALRHPTAGHVDMAAPHVDTAMHCVHQAFQEAIGGAAYAQCRAAEPTPAPREPDGWVVVDSDGRYQEAWGRYETHYAEGRAKSLAAQYGATARPFWLDAPPASDEAATLRTEVGKLRAALRAIAMTVGASVGEQASTEIHCLVADEAQIVVERLTRERDEARLGGVCHALGCMVEAYELGGASASKLAEMLGYHVGELHGSGLQAVANMIFEAATELPEAIALARQCRDVALGERERIADRLLGRTAYMVRNLPAPTLPEVP